MKQPIPSEDHFAAWVRSVSRLLSAYKDLSSTTSNHSTNLGKAREFFVSKILRSFLPKALHVGSGEIIDGDGHISRQIDVLIYRHDMPVLSSLAETNMYFVESVVSTIEVKSKLNAQSVQEALENCLSVKLLTVEFPSRGSGAREDFFALRKFAPSSYIFGYLGYKARLPALKDALFSWIKNQRIDSLAFLPEVIASEGCVILKNDYRSLDSNAFRRNLGYNPIFVAIHEQHPLHWLLHHLLGQISRSVLPNRSITELLRRSYISLEAQTLVDRADFWGEWDGDTGRIIRLEKKSDERTKRQGVR